MSISDVSAENLTDGQTFSLQGVEEQLLDKGYSLDYRSNAGDTLLHLLAKKRDLEGLRLALAAGLDPNQPNKAGNTAFHIAASKGEPTLVLALMEAGAEMAQNQLGQTPYHLALKNNHHEVLEAFENNGYVSTNRLKDQLIAEGYSPERFDEYDLVTKAVKEKRPDLLELIFEFFQDEDIYLDFGIDKLWASPLMVAAEKNDVQSITLLLENGANLNATDKNGNTALHRALMRGDEKMAHFLLDQEGIDVQKRNAIGIAPIHYATFQGSLAVVEKLISLGVDVNQLTDSRYVSESDKWTSSDWDAWAECSDPFGHIKGGYQYPILSPMAIAQRMENQELMTFLEEQGGKWRYEASMSYQSPESYLSELTKVVKTERTQIVPVRFYV